MKTPSTRIANGLGSPSAFNVGPVGGYDEADLIGYLGERLDVPVVTVRTPQRTIQLEVGSTKAADVLGYRFTWNVFEMVDEALAARGDQV